jgi:hypothetical protein
MLPPCAAGCLCLRREEWLGDRSPSIRQQGNGDERCLAPFQCSGSVQSGLAACLCLQAAVRRKS